MARRLVVLFAVAALAPAAWGQGLAGSVELTPTVGYWFGDTLGRGTTNAFDFDVNVEDAPMYGLRIGYRFAPNWALEGLIAAGNPDLSVGRGGLFESDTIGHMNVTVGEVGFEGSFGNSRFVPFIAGGIGAANLDPHVLGESLGSDTRFLGHFGGGFKVFFSPSTALRFDWRAHSVNVGNTQEHCSWWEECRHDEWLTFKEVSLGLTFVI